MRKRGFEKISEKQMEKDFKIKIKKEDIFIPARKTKNSVGYDFVLPYDIEFKKGKKVIIPTGIKAYMKNNEWLAIYTRSSLGFKYIFRLCNQTGIIDADYYNNIENEGHIFIAVINEGEKDILLKKGSAFAQGVFMNYLLIDNDESDKIRTGGIGSTDRRNKNE